MIDLMFFDLIFFDLMFFDLMFFDFWQPIANVNLANVQYTMLISSENHFKTSLL